MAFKNLCFVLIAFWTIVCHVTSKRVCKHDEFRCETDDVCIPKSHRCDYMEQCDDGTDEDDCECEYRCDAGMLSYYYPSGKTRYCIPTEAVCDGFPQCADGQDEEGCPCDGFRCESKRCIPSADRCDGFDDCFDGSDEQNC